MTKQEKARKAQLECDRLFAKIVKIMDRSDKRIEKIDRLLDQAEAEMDEELGIKRKPTIPKGFRVIKG
jgi:hypothetical protein